MNRKLILPVVGAALCALASGCGPSITKSGLDPDKFVTVVNGDTTALYTLTNPSGAEVCITNYGGRVVSLMVPDRTGKLTDVVLGHDSIDDYINIDGNFGALIGRYGNRIGGGTFTLDSVTYQLPKNNFGHCLHGGEKGFHHSVWRGEQTSDSTLTLTLKSPDGDAGFPGNIDVKVIYTLTADNALRIDYEATTDKPTILNLTNHTYFNLSGDASRDVMDHQVYFDAEGFTPIDSTFMTTGEIAPVEGTPFDFRMAKPIGRDIEADDAQLHNGRGYDHNMVLRHPGNLHTVAAAVTCPDNGITLEVMTSEPGIQFYTGNFLDGTVKGKKGIVYPRRSALCLETQHYPDSPNKPQWPSVRVNPGETYRSTCIYRFTAVP